MIRLASLIKEVVEFTPKGNLRIDPEDISPAKWERINRIIVQKGYNMRGGEDCKRAVIKFLSNPNNDEPGAINADIYGPWLEVIADVMNVKTPEQKSQGPSYDCKKVMLSAIRTYGKTTNPLEAGYILPHGTFLSLTNNRGTRDLDHREINSIYSKLGIDIPPDARQTNSNVMNAFMKDCRAIRIGGSSGFVDMMHEPTRQQARSLNKYFQILEGDVSLICRSQRFGSLDRTYPRGTHPMVILRDIVHFYKDGSFLSPEPKPRG